MEVVQVVHRRDPRAGRRAYQGAGRRTARGRFLWAHLSDRAGSVAAFNVLECKVVGQCMQRRRHREFIRFLNKIGRQTPAERDVHLILGNHGAHKHAKVMAWLERRPRFHFHFTPTSASWLNAIEGFFATLTRRPLKRGVFTGVAELQEAISRFINEYNQNPKPFVWTADPNRVVEKVNRGNQALASNH